MTRMPVAARRGAVSAGGVVLRTLFLGAPFLFLLGCGRGEATEAPRRTLAEVVRQDLEITAEASGQLEPLRKVEVKSKASGEVMEVLVDTGDRVEPGTLLVRIDPRDVRNDYNQAQADHQVARERYHVSEAQLRRSENLLTAGVITEQEHEGRNLEYANARANLVRAETNLELARLRLEDVTIRSPMHGVVLEKSVEEGQVIQSASGNVSGGTTLLTIANLDVVQVRTLVDETDVGRLLAGMRASVRVEAFTDRTFEGAVEKIEPQGTVQQNVVMFPVIVHLDNGEGILRPGMTAEVTVVVAERPSALTLPNNAIVGVNEVAAAVSVLGLDPSLAALDRSVFQELRARIERGEISMEEVRARFQQGGREAPAAGQTAGRERGASPSSRPSGGRPAVVFVEEPGGALHPRPVLLGVNDWNRSEILAGVEAGERVVLIGGAQLQAQQREMASFMRGRMGGGLPFTR
jgi:HlyD family secretion protein